MSKLSVENNLDKNKVNSLLNISSATTTTSNLNINAINATSMSSLDSSSPFKKQIPRISILHADEPKQKLNNLSVSTNITPSHSKSSCLSQLNNNNNTSSNINNCSSNRLSIENSLVKNSNSSNMTKKKTKFQNPCKIFRRAIPKMPKPLAILCCITNIFIPGSGLFYEICLKNLKFKKKTIFLIGTLISAFSILCCGTKHRHKNNIFAFILNFVAFLLQISSACIIFGWIWSIKYGILFVHLASE